MVGVVADEDDDGNAASSRPVSQAQRPVPQIQEPIAPSAKKAFATIMADWTGMSGTDLAAACRELATAQGVTLDAATDLQFSNMTETVRDFLEGGTDFAAWSASTKKPTGKRTASVVSRTQEAGK
jgi:hypothetical protein